MVSARKKKKMRKTKRRYYFLGLVSSWGSSFRITFSAVHRSASVGFEGNFAFLSTVGADCFVHLFSIHLALSTPYAI
jgi:hypothetical protein